MADFIDRNSRNEDFEMWPQLIEVAADVHFHNEINEFAIGVITGFCERITRKIIQSNTKLNKKSRNWRKLMAGIAELNAALDALDSSVEEILADIAALPEAPDLQMAVDRLTDKAQALRDALPTTPIVETPPAPVENPPTPVEEPPAETPPAEEEPAGRRRR